MLLPKFTGLALLPADLSACSLKLVSLLVWLVFVCSFLGGMRAVTWTQVAQYVILIIAYIFVAILSFNLTGNPVPHLVYGHVLKEVKARRKAI